MTIGKRHWAIAEGYIPPGSTDIGTMFLDEELRVRRYAPRTTDIFNLIAGDVGRPFAHLTHKLLEAGDLVADAERVLRDWTVAEMELASTDGRFYQTRLRPYRAIDNKVGGVVLTFVDVTDRHRREEDTQSLNQQLAAQKVYAESIIATVREPILVLDGNLRVVTASRAFYLIFETTRKPTEGMLLYELGDNQWDIPELRRLLKKILSRRTTVEAFEVRHDFGRGERIMLLNARRLRQGEEKESLILLAFEDITERKRAEDANTRLASIVDTTDDAIVSKNLDGVITTWNRSAEEMFGYTVEEVIGQPIVALIIPADRLEEEEDILRRITRGETIDHFETVRRHKDGSTLAVSVTISPLKDKHGRVIGASKVARDITERKRAEEHREMLIHELNHRVKNTLATVQSLAMQTFRGPGAKRALETFDARLLALSAAHNVLILENWRGARIREVVGNAIAAWSGGEGSRISFAGPDLRVRPSAALALSMALHELVTNAAKYGALSNEQGKIAIRWLVSTEAAPAFTLHWRERGGPPVHQPSRRGFGLRLIEDGLAQDLGGSVKLAFNENGVTCTIESPLDEIRERGGGG